MHNTLTQADIVDDLAEEFIARYRNGERPALSEFAARCPERADEIRELFPALVALEQAAQPGTEDSQFASDPQPLPLSQLGDFRIIREVGRGGMGVVYEAEQVSLGRRVALKVLPKQVLLDSRHKQRFEREARAAARLHHTNIVPVFGIGQQDGLHYYVMQFIHGLGLDEVLVELKRQRVEGPGSRIEAEGGGLRIEDGGWRGVRGDLSAVCVAQSLLSGRFERTVLVESDSDGSSQPSSVNSPPSTPAKPKIENPKSNIASPPTAPSDTVVDRLSDTQHASGSYALPGHSEHSSKAHSRSVYWQSVARIGVQAAEALQYAHDQGIVHRDVKPGNLLLDTRGCVWVTDFGLAKATDQQDLTHTGDVLGTLRYMAPEQFDGQADARSDVYSLGLTLYEMLALQPAFDETERHMLVNQVTCGTPARLRTLDRHVPRDLETIVHKAVEREAGQRYNSAGELAADLRRFLGDEPIHARRPPVLQRLAKWGRRHRAVIVTASVCLLVATALLAGTIGWAVRDGAAREAGVVRDRSERQARLTAHVEFILDDVERLQREESWNDALAAAKRAEAVLAAGEAEHGMHQKVRQAVMELELVRRLEQIRMERAALQDGNFDHAGTVEAFAQAFRQFGVDVQSLPADEVVTRLAAHRSIALPLAAALDQWANARRDAFGWNEPGWQSLAAVARELDPDPLREQLRTFRGRTPTPELHADLRNLVEKLDVRRQTPATLDWLAITLGRAQLDELQEQVLRQAQLAHPGDVWINNHLGIFLRERKNYDDAIRFFGAAVAARPTFPAAHTNLGNALADRGLTDEAIAEYREAIRLQPDFVVAHAQLGDALSRKGLTGEAIAQYREAVRHKPDYAPAHNNLGLALDRVGLTEEAIAALREAIRHQPNYAPAHNNLGLALSGTGLIDEAIAAYREALGHQPDCPDAHYNLGLALSKQGSTDEAIAAYREAIRLQPEDASAHNGLGALLCDFKRDYDGAIAAFREAIRLKPDLANAHSNLGNALSGKGLTGEAIAAYREAIRLQPDFAKAHRSLGIALYKAGLMDEAIAAYRAAICLQPEDARAHNGLGGLLCDFKRDYDGAIAAFREAIRIKPDLAQAHSNLGNALSGKGLTGEAIAAYRESIRLQPDFAAAHHNLGVALSREGLTDEAIAAYREAIRLNPDNANARYSLGHALSQNDLTNEAIAAYREAIRLQPDFAAAHNGLGALLCDFMQDYDGAIAAFREAIRHNPDLADAHSNLGHALSRKGLTDEAIAEYSNAIECHPQFASVHNNLAWLLANCTDPQFRNPARAVALGKRAVELSPHDGYFWNTLGVAHYRAAEWQSAIEALHKSMELRGGGDGFDWLFLAMAHWGLGNKDDARRWYDMAVAWMDKNRPEDEELRRFRAEAEELLGLKSEEVLKESAASTQEANGLIGGEM